VLGVAGVTTNSGGACVVVDDDAIAVDALFVRVDVVGGVVVIAVEMPMIGTVHRAR
jgi:hypothetical protein